MSNDLLKDKKIPLRTLFKRTWKYIAKEKWSFILSLALILITVVSGVILPRITGYYTDEISSINPSLNKIIWIAVLMLGMSIITQGFVLLETMILTKAGQRIVYSLRMEVFAHIESMSQNQFNDMAVGSLVTRVCNYTSQLSEFFTNILVKIVKDLSTVVVTYIWMMVLSYRLGLVLLGVVVLIFVISYVFSVNVHRVFSRERKQISDLNTYLNESLSGMKIVQLFKQEKKFEKTFNKKNNEYFKTKYKVTIAFAIYRPLISLIYMLTLALIIYYGVRYNLTAGVIVSFYLFLDYFFEPVQSLADSLNHITRAVSAIERLYNLLDIKPEVVDNKNAIEVDHFNGKIEFRNVSFAYEDDNYILKDVSFIINPKETIAFVGETGSGKTTILNLIVRNFEPQKGDIFIDDINIKDIKLSSLRKLIGQMLQDIFLFTGSIRNNITLFDDSYSDSEINKAVKYVNADTFINSLPNKLDEQILEKGESLSTGQRQLLSFARTILAKPQIMILDEATANIDSETEAVIQSSLNNIKNIGTMLVVAHRLSTIKNADQIFVLSHGEIIEKGNHEELMKSQGYYYNLYKLQYSES